MSTSQSSFGASAVNTCGVLPSSSMTAQRSSWTDGPGFFPFLPRFFPNALHQPFEDAIRHAVRSDITSPTSRASSAGSRGPNSGSSLWAAKSAFARSPATTPHGTIAPDPSPPQDPLRRRARPRAGTSLSRQVPLRQIRRRTPQHLVLLLQQPDPLARLSQLSALDTGLTGLGALVDIGTTEPFLQRHRVNAEITSDLLDPHSGLAVPRNAHKVITELSGIGLRHDAILPGQPSRANQIRCHLSVQQTPSRDRCTAT